MRENTLILFIIFALSLLVACDKSAPGCSDEETIELVTNIAKEELLENGFDKGKMDLFKFNLENIRTKSHDEKTGSNMCAADLVLKVEKIRKSLPITYLSELTEKTGEFYVTVYGL